MTSFCPSVVYRLTISRTSVVNRRGTICAITKCSSITPSDLMSIASRDRAGLMVMIKDAALLGICSMLVHHHACDRVSVKPQSTAPYLIFNFPRRDIHPTTMPRSSARIVSLRHGHPNIVKQNRAMEAIDAPIHASRSRLAAAACLWRCQRSRQHCGCLSSLAACHLQGSSSFVFPSPGLSRAGALLK